MPLKTRKASTLSNLTPEEKKLLVFTMAEMRARGLGLPDSAVNLKDRRWPVDENGYFVKNDGKQFNANEIQSGFISSTARFSGFFGGRGSGKSASGSQKAIKKLSQGQSGSVLNPDFENFKYSTWPEFRSWLPWELVVPSQRYRSRPEWEPQKPFTMVFLNGARAFCKGLKDPDSARGPNLNWLWYDEGGRDQTGMSWMLAIGGIRVGIDPQAWVTTTPKETDHWLSKFFVHEEIPEEAFAAFKEAMHDDDKKLVDHYFSSIDDNKENLDPAFYAQMLSMYPTGYLRDRELNGKFSDIGGTLGDRAWFFGKIIPSITAEERITGRVRYWDLAASEKKIAGKRMTDPDSTVGTRMSMEDGRFFIEDQVAAQVQWHDIKHMIIDTAMSDGVNVPIFIEQEPGSGGKNQVAEIASMSELLAYTVKPHNPKEIGDKVMRAQPWFARAALGQVYLLQGEWNAKFLDQVGNFPAGRHDDRVDSVSGAYAKLVSAKQWKTVPFLAM